MHLKYYFIIFEVPMRHNNIKIKLTNIDPLRVRNFPRFIGPLAEGYLFMGNPSMKVTLQEIQKDVKQNNWQKYAISPKWYGQKDRRETDAKEEMQRLLKKLSGVVNG